MTSPDPDRLRYAQIAGAVARHALGWRLTSDEEAVAVAELTEAAAGRADLLAERAGTALGFGEGRPDAARYRQIAELCIAAGADPALIEQWIKVGRERAAAAAAIPYTGLSPGGLLLPARAREPGPWRRRGLLGYLTRPGQSLVSMSVAEVPPTSSVSPTAVHFWLAPQDTPLSTLRPALGLLGVGCRAHAVPFQTSPSVKENT